MIKVICNTTPFIALASVGKICLLQIIYGSVIVPEAVIEEIEKGGKIFVPNLTSYDWISVVPNDTGQSDNLLFQLDYGERQVILHALKIQPDMILIDDRTARNIAEYLGVKVKGTLGVLVEAKRKGLIPSFKRLAMEMKAQGIRFSQRLIEEIALKLGE